MAGFSSSLNFPFLSFGIRLAFIFPFYLLYPYSGGPTGIPRGLALSQRSSAERPYERVPSSVPSCCGGCKIDKKKAESASTLANFPYVRISFCFFPFYSYSSCPSIRLVASGLCGKPSYEPPQSRHWPTCEQEFSTTFGYQCTESEGQAPCAGDGNQRCQVTGERKHFSRK